MRITCAYIKSAEIKAMNSEIEDVGKQLLAQAKQRASEQDRWAKKLAEAGAQRASLLGGHHGLKLDLELDVLVAGRLLAIPLREAASLEGGAAVRPRRVEVLYDITITTRNDIAVSLACVGERGPWPSGGPRVVSRQVP